MTKTRKPALRVGFNLGRELRLAPSYLVLTLWVSFTAIIFFWVIAASLSSPSAIFNNEVFRFAEGVKWENYSKAWTDSNVHVFFANSLFYAVSSCALLILICAPYAYALQRFKFPFRGSLRTMLAATTGVPMIMIIIPLYMIISGMGVFNHELLNRVVLVLLFTCTKIPYTTIFLMAYFENISRSYEEAAAIDGSHPIMTFWRIVFPMAQGGLVTVTIFNFISIWNEYFLSLLFANKESLRPVALGLFSMINSMQYTGDWGGLFASVIIVFLPTFVLYVALSRKIIGGLVGGVKG